MNNGRIYSLGLPSIAGNASYLIPSYGGSGWGVYRELEVTLLYAYLTLTTDATVATRNLTISIVDGSGNELMAKIVGGNVTASSAGVTSYAAGMVYLNGITLSGTTVHVPFTVQYPLQIKLSVTNGVAGDAITGRITLRERAA